MKAIGRRQRRAGDFVVLEGPDGVGKSTLAEALASELRAQGVPAHLVSFPGKEAGTLGSHVYQLHHTPERLGIKAIDQTSLQILHVAAHVDIIERTIRPLLKDRQTVVLDRYWWSTWVYGLELGASAASLRVMIELEKLHWKDIASPVVFLLRRRVPFRDNDDGGRFARLNARYRALAKTERQQKVHILRNDGTVKQEVRRIIALLK
jgi:thymidylate kinase